jgi:large subunit ribosomal protein L23
MALFSLKKDTQKKKTTTAIDAVSETKKVSSAEPTFSAVDTASILLHPRVTEKASMLSEKGIYTFDMSPRATQKEVIAALKKVYNVVPVKVNIVSVPSKQVRMRTKNAFGVKSGGKKAYVYLKKGETIDTV